MRGTRASWSRNRSSSGSSRTVSRGRGAWELAGAVLTDDVAPFEQAKLRLLNGTHSLLAYAGALAGTGPSRRPSRIPRSLPARASSCSTTPCRPSPRRPGSTCGRTARRSSNGSRTRRPGTPRSRSRWTARRRSPTAGAGRSGTGSRQVPSCGCGVRRGGMGRVRRHGPGRGRPELPLDDPRAPELRAAVAAAADGWERP
ncbi:hypothetical protein NKG05_06930 [Oerskovia sp. M15]